MTLENSEPIYPISVAAKLLSVHPRTLRIYEEEGLVKPARQKSKRYYSNDDLEWIRCLRALIHDKGISIPGIKMLLELTPCWEITKCPEDKRENCSAYIDRSTPCWQLASSVCKDLTTCEKCAVYIRAMQEAKKVAGVACNGVGTHPGSPTSKGS